MMWKSGYQLLLLACLSSVVFMGCEEEEKEPCTGVGPTRCLKAFPATVTTEKDGVIVSAWAPDDTGPRCVYGGTFRTFLKKGGTEPVKDLTVRMPHIGAWLPRLPPLILSSGGTSSPSSFDDVSTDYLNHGYKAIDESDFLYVPPCDGSLFLGSRDYSVKELEEGNYSESKDPRYYRGFINSTSAINQAAEYNTNPERVFLIGSGAGSFGTIAAAVHTAEKFPNSQIFALIDGSPGLGSGYVYPKFTDTITEEYAAESLIPTDCPDCIANGHLTRIIDYTLNRYRNVHFAAYASTQELSVPLFINMWLDKIYNPTASQKLNISDDDWSCFIQKQFETLRKKFEDTNRFNYFVVDRGGDTINAVKGGSPENNGQNYRIQVYNPESPQKPTAGPTFKEWLTDYLDNSSNLKSYAEIEMNTSCGP